MRFRPLDRLPELGLLVALAALVIALVATEPGFRTKFNLLLILDQSSVVLIVAVPFAMLLISRHVDLSVGSAVALAGVVGGNLLTGGTSALLACAVVILVAAGIGLVNGVLCAYLGLSSIVVTLGMLVALRGLAFMLQPDDEFTSGFSHAFAYLGQGRFVLGDIPIKVAIAAVVLGVACLFLYRTRKGRHAQAIGASPSAAYLSGIRVSRTALGLYVATGLGVGLAALIMISELDSSPPDIANGFEITVLTAVLLGGVAFTGGRGSLWGVALGVLFIHTLSNGFTFWGLTTDQVRLANGLVLVLAAGLQALALWIGGHWRPASLSLPGRPRRVPARQVEEPR